MSYPYYKQLEDRILYLESILKFYACNYKDLVDQISDPYWPEDVILKESVILYGKKARQALGIKDE